MGIWKKLFGTKGPASARAAEKRQSRPDVKDALAAAGYKATFERPVSPDAMVDSIVQSMLARQSAMDQGTFETGEKNPQRILCSDNECPCTDRRNLVVGRTAYLYISQDVVDFRKDCRSLLEREMKLKQMAKRMGGVSLLIDHGVANPFYLCEVGARRRRLDLSAALADAKMVAETGFAPLRATPNAR